MIYGIHVFPLKKKEKSTKNICKKDNRNKDIVSILGGEQGYMVTYILFFRISLVKLAIRHIGQNGIFFTIFAIFIGLFLRSVRFFCGGSFWSLLR